MSSLHGRLEEDLLLRDRAEPTRRAYLQGLTDLECDYQRSPDELSPDSE